MENIFKEEREVMSEYCNADLHDRIVMFLHYRELRQNFAEIDQVKKDNSIPKHTNNSLCQFVANTSNN